MPSANKAKNTPIILTLPCLGQSTTDDGNYQTETYKITTKVPVKEMKERLAAYGQDTDGTRAEVIARLEAFAGNVSEWKVLFHPKQKRKRGDATGIRAQSHSAKRIAVMFAETEPKATVYSSKRPNLDRPGAVAMTEFQKAQLDDWTGAVLASYSLSGVSSISTGPLQTSTDTSSIETTINSRLQDLALDSATASESGDAPFVNVAMRRNLRQFENLNRKLEQRIDSIPIATQPRGQVVPQPLPTGISSTALRTQSPQFKVVPQTTPEAMAVTRYTPEVPSVQFPVALVPSASSLDVTQSQTSTPQAWPQPIKTSQQAAEFENTEIVQDQTTEAHQISVMLGSERVAFDASQIPDPPRRHYSQDIPALFQDWEHGELLKIQGRAIPLKYWPEIYQKRNPRRNGKLEKADVWDLMKVEYGNWRYLVEEKERLGSEAAFWAAYSNAQGERLQFTHILKRLKSHRTSTYQEDAQAAREYFGGNLDRPDAQGVFQYAGKGRRTVTYSKDKRIAEQWRKLLDNNPVVAANWEAMRAAKVASTHMHASSDL